MQLTELLRERLDDPCVPLADDTVKHYDRCIRQYGQHLGRVPSIADLERRTLMSWAAATVEEGRSPHTANQRMKQIRALWAWGFEAGVVSQHPPKRLGVRCERVVPDSWSGAELGRIFAAAGRQSGWIGPHRASDFWLGVLWYAWNTGARSGEIWELEPSMLDLGARQASVPARVRKGGEVAMRWWLTPRCVDALGRVIDRSETRVFERHWNHKSCSSHHFGKLIVAAGLPLRRRNGLQKIRRTVATQIEIRGGRPGIWLGHAPTTVAEASYVDRWAVQTSLRNVWPLDSLGGEPD